MQCKSCGSDSTRKFSVVYEEGTTTGKSETLSGNEITHFSQTPLAKRCAPPKEPEIGGFLAFLILITALYAAIRTGIFFQGFFYYENRAIKCKLININKLSL